MRLRAFLWFAAMLLAGLAAPAFAAITDDVIACANSELPDSAKAQLSLLGNGSEENISQEASREIANATFRCATRYQLTQDEDETVRLYITASHIADSAGTYLAGAGMPLAVLHETLDFGPGYQNVKVTEMTQERVTGLLNGLAQSGVDTAIFTSREWNVLGLYIGAETDRQTLLVPFQQ